MRSGQPAYRAGERLRLVAATRDPLALRGGFPLGFGFPSPLFRIMVVHLLHLLRNVWMILGYVLNHQANHVVPRFRLELLITGATQILACHGLHQCPPFIWFEDLPFAIVACV